MGRVGEWGGLGIPMVPISPLLCRTECDIHAKLPSHRVTLVVSLFGDTLSARGLKLLN